MVAFVSPGAATGQDTPKASTTAQLQAFPTRPRAGQLTTLQLRPYHAVATRLEPALVPANHRWLVTAVRQGRSPIGSLYFSRDADDPYLWTTTFRFRSAGPWLLRIAGDKTDAPLELSVLRRGPVGSWARLERPLHTPSIAPRSACPTSARDPKGDLSRIGYVGPAWGAGPGYPVIPFDQERPVLYYDDPIPPESLIYGSKWFGQKVLWVIDRQVYRGPVLIRGRQVDGMNKVRFGLDLVPVPEMKAGPSSRDRPSTTRVRAPGCYAYQVDGTTFSSVIVFETRPYSK